ncbi:hypothetical protein [Massilia aquatica]|uniref:Uncharacterized protein n=1 Tax=Massilia aquatica TaxID=2609000 RepID=A0ABX0MEH5_9BURK|nr:hypothetical protein [Massilia aquatica]NHZ43323.1 hypothetical protein [Massilia aquatica]
MARMRPWWSTAASTASWSLSSAVTMRLDGGDYHAEQVPFSACFLRHAGRNVLVHRSAWNRLDVADAASGASLTERVFDEPEGDKSPGHYHNRFRGRIAPARTTAACSTMDGSGRR